MARDEKRLSLEVTAEGVPSISFLDTNGSAEWAQPPYMSTGIPQDVMCP
jgi:hypothetical protein